MKHFIRQQCVAAILKVLERAACTGVRCVLKTRRGRRANIILMPRLIAMNLDSPDARMYFGLLNKSCCSKCNRRKGRSAFRRGRLQQGSVVQCLYGIVEYCKDPDKVLLASQKLQRLGFNPKRRCLLTLVCDKLLIRRPTVEDEVFPSVDFRDRMHALYIFLHRKFVECIVGMKLSKSTRQLLDRRLAALGMMRSFHDPTSGKSTRVLRSMFTDANMTATDKVSLIFLLPHVFGHRAVDLPLQYREPFLTMIAYAQILLIAVRGRRAYNVRELHKIFNVGWIMLFGAMERIRSQTHDVTYAKKLKKHRKNPKKNKMPKPYSRTPRFVKLVVCDEFA